MRTGICTLPQALTPESETTVKQAMNLARRRGHAQVTPLHVASAMLGSSTGLLRRACLQCHSHPLQCKALELCFNVALNRLPASTQSPLLGHHYSNVPSLSNALVAAFKRAQAHQRRGSIENQQQPILALKIELEQLIISILDDPSVSRVMREAGFSSPQVKNRVEQTVSLEPVCSNDTTPPPSLNTSHVHSKETVKPLVVSTNINMSKSSLSLLPFDRVPIRNEDVMSVFEELSNYKRKRSIVIVAESEASAESVIRGVMEKFERGNMPRDLRYVQFINLPLFSLRNMSREQVEQKVIELRYLVKSYVGRGLVLYLGDLKWVSEFWSNYSERRSYYSPMEQMIMELKRLVSGNIGENGGRLWLMGIATFQTYMKCNIGHPSIETILELQPLTVPVGSLSLSLNLDSKDFCSSAAVEKDLEPSLPKTSMPLPPWLQKSKEESTTNTTRSGQECINNVKDLCEKWNSFCSSTHKTSLDEDNDPKKHMVIIDSITSPPNWAATSFGSKQAIPIKEYQFWVSENVDENNRASQIHNEPKPIILSNPNSSPNSASSSEILEDIDGLQKFKIFNAENLTLLIEALEKIAPWQTEAVHEISTTILQCRSKMMIGRRKLGIREDKEETWLSFLGNVLQGGKEKIAKELAKLVFGSYGNFVSINISSNFSSNGQECDKKNKKKRRRDELGSCSYVQRFAEAVNENPHRLFLMEDIEQADYCSLKGIKEAIEKGSVMLGDGDFVPLKDAIIVICCEDSKVAISEDHDEDDDDDDGDDGNADEDKVEEKSSTQSVSLDLNIAIELVDEHDSVGGNLSTNHVAEILECVDGKIQF